MDGSVLWLLSGNPSCVGNLRRAAEELGVDPSRLVFAPRAMPPDHLARQRLADLFLDTLPYNAHTTASDALWVGLPLVTCRGATFAGRVAASLLTAIGLPELIWRSGSPPIRQRSRPSATGWRAIARPIRCSTPRGRRGLSNGPSRR